MMMFFLFFLKKNYVYVGLEVADSFVVFAYQDSIEPIGCGVCYMYVGWFLCLLS